VLGFDFPGLPSLIGPYSVFDARLSLTQTVLDLARFSALDAADAALQASRAQASIEREQLAARVATAFIGTLAAQARVDSALADIDLSEQLLNLARSRLKLGLASGVDVLRAETLVSQSRFATAEARTALMVSRLQLQGVSQLPLDPDALVLTGDLEPSQPAVTEPKDGVLNDAWSRRPEVKLIRAMTEKARAELAQARRQRLPTVTAFADYGLSANTPSHSEEDTYRFGAMVSLPVFTGGALRAGESARELELEQQLLRLTELHRRVNEDVLQALAATSATAEQVRAAQATVALAAREVESARDRFAHGVADNLDVVSAQAALTRARSQRVGAHAAHQQARLSLALARGRAIAFDLGPSSETNPQPGPAGEAP
jgi:outer membrane protein TolC